MSGRRCGSSPASRSLTVRLGQMTRKASGEPLVCRAYGLVERRPGDRHGHDQGLACAGRHLGAPSLEGLYSGYLQPHPALCGRLCEERDGLHGFLLSEERPQARLAVAAEPAREQFSGDVGCPDIAIRAPGANAAAEVVDEVQGDKIAGDGQLTGSRGVRRQVAGHTPAFGDDRRSLLAEVPVPRWL